MNLTLQNHLLRVEISTHGAELQRITNVHTGWEYLYQGDSPFWGRRSPVLFPIVGSVWDGKYRMDGREYAMGQHGFARDSEFTPLGTEADDEVWLALDSSADTLQRYPRLFRLEVGYRLHDERITVMWRVHNLDTRTMHFQIGAHPAFRYPGFSPSDPVHAYLMLDAGDISTPVLADKGCLGPDTVSIATDAEGMLPVTADTFSINTIMVEGARVHRVSMLDKARTPYLSVLFQAPVVGIWSPSHQAPFVCIEPWYGRCDRMGFTDEFGRREWVNALAPSARFDARYMIVIEDV